MPAAFTEAAVAEQPGGEALAQRIFFGRERSIGFQVERDRDARAGPPKRTDRMCEPGGEYRQQAAARADRGLNELFAAVRFA
jgi:hypothetical protein